ncbi:MAG: hypothetical protein ACJA2O_001920 [Candidatus Azotimanducaceae bacterium]|jgi:hypothetical protein
MQKLLTKCRLINKPFFNFFSNVKPGMNPAPKIIVWHYPVTIETV